MMREALVAVGTVAFAVSHLLWYTRVVAYRLWEVTGGIRHDGALTVYGASEWAWTVPVQLPAGLLFWVGAGPVGLALLFAGSITAGFPAASLVASLTSEAKPRLGTRAWRIWLFLAGWGWVPVPATLSWVYQWTVVY